MDGELRLYFPQKFNDIEETEFFYNLKKRLDAELAAMIDPSLEDEAERIKQLTIEYMATMSKPKSFANTPDSFLVAQEKSFEGLCCLLEDNGTQYANRLTVYEFFTRCEYIERKYKPQST